MSQTPAEVAQSLRRVPIFAEFSDDELATVVAHTRHRLYKPEDIIFEQDDPGTSFHLLERGVVKIYLSSDDGRDVVFAILQAGEFFGELALIDGLPRSASASALELSETLEVRREDFQRTLDQHPAAAKKVCAVLAARLRRSDGIIADAAFLDLRSRLAKRMLELAQRFGRASGGQVELEVRLRQRDLAEMVGATRESVNRALSAMETEGLVSFQRGRLTLHRVADLQRLTDYGVLSRTRF